MIEVTRDTSKGNPDVDLHDFFINLVAVMKKNFAITIDRMEANSLKVQENIRK
jgi:hypothetical protein